MKPGFWLTQKLNLNCFNFRDFYNFEITDYLGNTRTRTYVFRTGQYKNE